MSKKVAPVVDEAIETLNMKDGPTRRRLIEGAGLFSATAAASALISACTSSTGSTASDTKAVAGDFPATPKWKFTFVNHVTDNQFFTPTRYGFADCARLLGLPDPAWTGASSVQSTVPTMLSAMAARPAAVYVRGSAFAGSAESARFRSGRASSIPKNIAAVLMSLHHWKHTLRPKAVGMCA